MFQFSIHFFTCLTLIVTTSYHPVMAGMKDQPAIAHYGGQEIPNQQEVDPRDFLKSWVSAEYLNGIDADDIKLLHELESPVSRHYTFIQTYNNLPVFGTQVKVNISRQGKVLSVFDLTLPPEQWKHLPEEPTIIHAPQMRGNKSVKKQERVIFIDENFRPLHAFSQDLHNPETLESFRRITSINGEILHEEDLKSYHNINRDSLVTVQAKVFLPNPISSANTTYGGPYAHNSGNDTEELNNERFTVDMQVWKTHNDTLYLNGPFVRIGDFSAPTTEETFSTDSTFFYNRSETGFKEANAYYHIHTFQEYIRSLGFTELFQDAVYVDAMALGNRDNSEFDPLTNRIYFGTGGVPDAEDADVIIHEYSHALSFYAAPGTRGGSERAAIEEGLCDYFACSYARYLVPDRWEDLMNWDGHNEFWQGRWCTTNKIYPDDFHHFGSIYQNGEIWAGTLMEIWGKIGRDTTDALMLTTLYSLATNMSMRDAAKIFLLNDTLLYDAANSLAIREIFIQNGLLEDTTNNLLSDIPADPCRQIAESVFQYEEAEGISGSFQEAFTGEIHLYDLTGRLLLKTTIQNETSITLSEVSLPGGVYLLTFISGDCRITEKLLVQN